MISSRSETNLTSHVKVFFDPQGQEDNYHLQHDTDWLLSVHKL